MDETLPEIVRRNALSVPDNLAFAFLRDGETESERLTFREVHERASRLAAAICECAEIGAPALLLYTSAPAFTVAFLACLFAGIIAVPVNVPRRRQSLDKLIGVLQNCQARLVLTETALITDLRSRFENEEALRSVHLYATDQRASAAAEWIWREVPADSIAFLQYTSGSTGRPKGVAVSHGNLIANQRMIRESFGAVTARGFAGWLPFHHDMGLMATIVQPLFQAVPAVLMPPGAFVQKPARWLKTISKYGATVSGGPNFAYDLCVRRCTDEELEGVDLSNWQVAFNGAEPVRAATLLRFAERFRRFSFSARSFLPCYGMAEATLFVSSVAASAGATFYSASEGSVHSEVGADDNVGVAPPVGDVVVSCGFGRFDQKILIVDPSSRRQCKEGGTGEIWLGGSNIARGYWRNETATAETFGARLADIDDAGFMRTGDLGFLIGGNLYVAGRIKELIIIRGRNFYPHDIEETVSEAHPALQACPTAAVSIDSNGEERLVVIQEVPRTHLKRFAFGEVEASIREKLTEVYELSLHKLLFVKTGLIPKTSSGKTQRRLCAELYLRGEIQSIQQDACDSIDVRIASGAGR